MASVPCPSRKGWSLRGFLSSGLCETPPTTVTDDGTTGTRGGHHPGDQRVDMTSLSPTPAWVTLDHYHGDYGQQKARHSQSKAKGTQIRGKAGSVDTAGAALWASVFIPICVQQQPSRRSCMAWLWSSWPQLLPGSRPAPQMPARHSS